MSECPRCNLSEKCQERPLLSVQNSLALQSPFLNPVDLFHIIHSHWLHPCDNANRAGGTRATGRRERGGGVFCIFPAMGPESFNWIPCRVPGKWAGLFNDYLRLICFLLLLALDVVFVWMDPYRCGGQDGGQNMLYCRQPCLSINSISKVADVWHLCICYSPLSKTDMSIITSL